MTTSTMSTASKAKKIATWSVIAVLLARSRVKTFSSATTASHRTACIRGYLLAAVCLQRSEHILAHRASSVATLWFSCARRMDSSTTTSGGLSRCQETRSRRPASRSPSTATSSPAARPRGGREHSLSRADWRRLIRGRFRHIAAL